MIQWIKNVFSRFRPKSKKGWLDELLAGVKPAHEVEWTSPDGRQMDAKGYDEKIWRDGIMPVIEKIRASRPLSDQLCFVDFDGRDGRIFLTYPECRAIFVALSVRQYRIATRELAELYGSFEYGLSPEIAFDGYNDVHVPEGVVSNLVRQ